ncbi:MAG TPA: TIGR03621 family F420-dependent LLM class oxidoreductase [Pseudonocardiaceae bacterium]|jgi:probable F420-dependent oxidoreductase|nr:TIGR03621 family F420-dependent LLM class oxidoreductase [Pseudonocardiaceae bacterium]
MSDRKFRFGVVAAQTPDMASWTGLVRAIEDDGYSTVLVPDTFGTPEPFIALSAAAAVTTQLRLAPFVLAAPLRQAGTIARDTASLDRLSGGRFELGLGAGRPDAQSEADLLGVPFGSAGERIEQVAETIRSVRSMFAVAAEAAEANQGRPFSAQDYLRPAQQPGPPIMIAGQGRRMLGLAGQYADIVTLGVPATATEDELGQRVATLRELAGDRFRELELGINIFSVGDNVPQWLVGRFGVDPSKAAGNSAVSMLTGDTNEIVDVLQRRRDRLGISYVTVSVFAMDAFTPVVERLAGR